MRYEQLFAELHDAGIRYLVAGGMAVNLHGYVRATLDLDLIVSFQDRNLSAFIGLAAGLGLSPTAPVELGDLASPDKRRLWFEQKGMRALCLHSPDDPLHRVDVLIDPGIDFEGLYSRRLVPELRGTPLPLVSLSDLIEMKERSRRARDRSDARELRALEDELER